MGRKKYPAHYDIPKLVARRLALGWDQTKLAYLTQLSTSHICRIEQGLYHRPETIVKIAHTLGLSPEDIVVVETDMPTNMPTGKPSTRRRKKEQAADVSTLDVVEHENDTQNTVSIPPC
jgi:transcriptional regulator with XRE-family HTH domain